MEHSYYIILTYYTSISFTYTLRNKTKHLAEHEILTFIATIVRYQSSNVCLSRQIQGYFPTGTRYICQGNPAEVVGTSFSKIDSLAVRRYCSVLCSNLSFWMQCGVTNRSYFHLGFCLGTIFGAIFEREMNVCVRFGFILMLFLILFGMMGVINVNRDEWVEMFCFENILEFFSVNWFNFTCELAFYI